MISRTSAGGLFILALLVACGPRLRSTTAADKAVVEPPVAKLSLQFDAAKLDENHKYKEGGKFTVAGLFFKAGQPEEATVNVTLAEQAGKVTRAYDLELENLGGAQAKVEMWDGGFLTVSIPDKGAPAPLFETSNESIRAVGVPLAGGQGPESTCYFAKEVLDGQLRFALCELQSQEPRLAFVDAVGTAAEAEAPPAAPSPETAAPAATPAN